MTDVTDRSDSPAASPPEPSEGWKGIQEVANASEAALIAGFLESSGIPARVVDRSFHQTPTSDEELTGIEIAVPVERAEEARQALAGRETAFASSPEGEDRLLTNEGLKEIDSDDSTKSD